MQELKALPLAALLATILVSANALASEPAGVWVKVKEVVYAPDATNPTHVQLHGALMLFDGNAEAPRPYPGYTSPALGYVYYQCPDGQAEICRQEWSDLQANIAKPDTECLGFGRTTLPTGTLRQPGEAPQGPDPYPIQNGVSPGFSPCQALAQFLAEEAASGGAGGAGSSGGTSASSGGAPASMSGATATQASGSSGTASGGSRSGATTAGRPGSGGPPLDPEEPTEKTSAESRAVGCSVSGASAAASLLGMSVAVGALVLGFARRTRRRK